MDNLYIKDMVASSGAKLYCVGTNWTLNQVVSFLIENDIPACPVTNASTNKGIIRQIEGYAVLKELSLKLKEYGKSPIKDFMNEIALIKELKPVEWIEVESLPKSKSGEKPSTGSTH